MYQKLIQCFVIVVLMLTISCEQKMSTRYPQKTAYEVVFRNAPAGIYEKKVVDENRLSLTYRYTDRGRGPEYIEEITLNEMGLISYQSVSGVNYRKTKVEEKFRQAGGMASWVNMLGDQEERIQENQLYFRYDGSPAIYEILARELLTSEEGKVQLFPTGTAELFEEHSITLSNEVGLRLLLISGLDLNPTYIWMDDEEMVAKISGNLHVVRQDLLGLREEMVRLQNEVENNYLKDVARRLTTQVNSLLIKNVNVFLEDGSMSQGQDVLVEKGVIKAISATAPLELEIGMMELDGTGKTLMPGMFDMHTHNTKFRGLLHLAGGITSVRDLANNKQLKELSAQFDANEILGPRIQTFCGIIDGSGPFANQRNVVNTLEEGLVEIQAYKDLGYQQIKLYSSIRPEWVQPLVDKAHDLGMRVSGHIPAYMTASQAIAQGYNEIQHINMLFLNFLPDTIDTRTPLRFTMPAIYGKDLDLSSKEYQAFIRQLKANEILVDPTMGIFENMFVSERGKVSPTYEAIFDRLPIMNQRNFYAGGLPKEGNKLDVYRQSYDRMLEVVYDLYQQGVALVPGTDGLPGFLYHRELELYVKAGIPAAQVLRLATIKSAEITGTSKTLGSIEVGKQADLVLIDGNPTLNISDIRRVEWTLKDGRLYYSKDLYKTQGIKPF